MSTKVNYNFTVPSLLEKAGRSRKRDPECGRNNAHTDHIVELQLVVAALNTLRKDTYWSEGWLTRLVDFFNEGRNLQCLASGRNQLKGTAVGKLIRGERLSNEDRRWIISIRDRWNTIGEDLEGFKKFKRALDAILDRV